MEVRGFDSRQAGMDKLVISKERYSVGVSSLFLYKMLAWNLEVIFLRLFFQVGYLFGLGQRYIVCTCIIDC